MKTSKVFLWLIVTSMLFSCRNKNEKLNFFLTKAFSKLENGEVLVIPHSGGCTGCISEAENAVDSLIKTKNIKIIFTNIQSLKTLKYRLNRKGINILDSNVFVDTANLYFQSSKDFRELWNYPTKIIVKDKVAVKVLQY